MAASLGGMATGLKRATSTPPDLSSSTISTAFNPFRSICGGNSKTNIPAMITVPTESAPGVGVTAAIKLPSTVTTNTMIPLHCCEDVEFPDIPFEQIFAIACGMNPAFTLAVGRGVTGKCNFVTKYANWYSELSAFAGRKNVQVAVEVIVEGVVTLRYWFLNTYFKVQGPTQGDSDEAQTQRGEGMFLMLAVQKVNLNS